MAVVVKYVVERNGKEVMTFANKKEADAYDKQLDIAEGLYEFMLTAKLDIADKTLDDMAFFLAKHRDQVARLLKGQAPTAAGKTEAKPAAAVTNAADNTADTKSKPKAKSRNQAKAA